MTNSLAFAHESVSSEPSPVTELESHEPGAAEAAPEESVTEDSASMREEEKWRLIERLVQDKHLRSLPCSQVEITADVSDFPRDHDGYVISPRLNMVLRGNGIPSNNVDEHDLNVHDAGYAGEYSWRGGCFGAGEYTIVLQWVEPHSGQERSEELKNISLFGEETVHVEVNISPKYSAISGKALYENELLAGESVGWKQTLYLRDAQTNEVVSSADFAGMKQENSEDHWRAFTFGPLLPGEYIISTDYSMRSSDESEILYIGGTRENAVRITVPEEVGTVNVGTLRVPSLFGLVHNRSNENYSTASPGDDKATSPAFAIFERKNGRWVPTRVGFSNESDTVVGLETGEYIFAVGAGNAFSTPLEPDGEGFTDHDVIGGGSGAPWRLESYGRTRYTNPYCYRYFNGTEYSEAMPTSGFTLSRGDVVTIPPITLEATCGFPLRGELKLVGDPKVGATLQAELSDVDLDGVTVEYRWSTSGRFTITMDELEEMDSPQPDNSQSDRAQSDSTQSGSEQPIYRYPEFQSEENSYTGSELLIRPGMAGESIRVYARLIKNGVNAGYLISDPVRIEGVSSSDDADSSAQSDSASGTDKPSVMVDDLSATPGQELTFTARDFDPAEPVSFVVHSQLINVGTTTADKQGIASIKWTVPAGFELGEHTVIATGLESGKISKQIFTVGSKYSFLDYLLGSASTSSSDPASGTMGVTASEKVGTSTAAQQTAPNGTSSLSATASTVATIGASANRKSDSLAHTGSTASTLVVLVAGLLFAGSTLTYRVTQRR